MFLLHLAEFPRDEEESKDGTEGNEGNKTRFPTVLESAESEVEGVWAVRAVLPRVLRQPLSLRDDVG